ncbi:Tetratricopeptide repeat-containing protein [Granulicella rosea]|uniref:Tetratricopeptide repeat-containing protein n=1 Tax=Granulicella rosea TaxID=474952 RepID=A0A239D7I0_9BACT|nr:tetratricopeptide repeat protein [Granulicella rosea]SNS28239.1 Tetratricopeptide repeat-containing protein [Granulicella rosea]
MKTCSAVLLPLFVLGLCAAHASAQGAAQSAAQIAAQLDAQNRPVAAQHHEANFDAERKQANELFLADKFLESLPLYEDLCRRDQTIAVFAERHGIDLIKKSGTIADPAASRKMHNDGLAELRRAQKLGDNSPLVQTILGDAAKSPLGAILSGVPLTVGYSYQGTPQAQEALKRAEAVFATNDYAGALKFYQQAAALDPKLYTAALYSGDMYFRLKDAKNAGVWYQKAIDIDPNRETAWRYWGDVYLVGGSEPALAKEKYEQAVIAEPYGRPGWLALQKWAKAVKGTVRTPVVALPKFSTPDGKLAPDPALATETGNGHASWLVYEKERVAHGARTQFQPIVAGGSDANGQLTPTGYRHSLAEESASLRAMLLDVTAKLASGAVTQESLEPSLRTLLQLQKDGLLECWIVVNDADAGIRYDYPAYRKEHRDLLATYIDRYIVPQP